MKDIMHKCFHKEDYGKVKLHDPMDIEARRHEFRHKPLTYDSKSPAIRLIKVLSSSHFGSQLRCRMRLSSTEDDYTCLSYVWGEPAPGQWIVVNGKWFFARANLQDFLSQARKLSQIQSRWLWIDAICIDQSNILERQTQVQQMGVIFSAAREVISWFGVDDGIAKFLEPSQNEGLDVLCHVAFETSPYWKRAWITQEFVLGREVKLLAASTLTPLEPTANHPAWTLQQRVGYPMPDILKTRNAYWQTQSFGLPSSTLFQLLDAHGSKLCHIRRDSVFSLLGLCRYGNKVTVDYGVSDAEVALNVLQSHSESFCLCFLSLLRDILDLESEYYLFLEKRSIVFGLQTYGVIHLGLKPGQHHVFDQLGLQDAEVEESENKSSSETDICFGSISVESASSSQPWDRLAISIVIDLARVCPMYDGTVTVNIDAGNFRYSVNQLSGTGDRGSYKNRPPHPEDESIHLKVYKERDECMCAFSMGFWLRLAMEAFPRASGPERCCSRKYEDRHYVATKMALTFPSILFATGDQLLERRFVNTFSIDGSNKDVTNVVRS